MLNLLPDSVWAMLVHGREAVSPSVSLVCDDDAHEVSALGLETGGEGTMEKNAGHGGME